MRDIEFIVVRVRAPFNGPVRLPSARFFHNRRYNCCHQVNVRWWIHCQFFWESRENTKPAFSLSHPRCCNSAWAVACYYLALRKFLKRELDRQQFLATWDALVIELSEFFPYPKIDGAWQLKRELSLENDRRRADLKAVEIRKQAVSNFLQNGGSSGHAVIPQAFRELGFSDWPETLDEIKSRFRFLAKRAHPDQGGSKVQFVQLRKAYEAAVEIWLSKS